MQWYLLNLPLLWQASCMQWAMMVMEQAARCCLPTALSIDVVFFLYLSRALSRDDLLDIFGIRMSLDNQVNQTKRHNDEPFCRCDKTAHTTTYKHFVLHAVWCKSAHRLCAQRKTSWKYTQSLIKSKIQIKFHCNGTTVCTWLTNEFYIFTSESSL